MGAGAVGCYYGAMFARAGAPVTLIGRLRHVEAIARDGLLFESGGERRYIHVSASTDVGAVRGADVVLFCVKTPDTEEAARALAPHLRQDAVVVSLQNGVDNVERMQAVAGIDAVPVVVYVGAEMAAPGHVKHTASGNLIIGDLGRQAPREGARRRRLESLAALFVRAGVPCTVSDNIEAALWTKLIVNCAYNALSALSRSRYRRMVSSRYARDLMRQVVDEALAVARAASVEIDDAPVDEAVAKIARTMPETISSTAQDLSHGKRTEIDALNGYVARRGATLGVPTPVNETLHALVKLLEDLVCDAVAESGGPRDHRDHGGGSDAVLRGAE
jgi:2-dehydropantoate 2-reductase